MPQSKGLVRSLKAQPVRNWLVALTVLCLAGCGDSNQRATAFQKIAFVQVASVSLSDKPRALEVLQKYGIDCNQDSEGGSIEVINTDAARAAEALKADSAQKGYAVWWAK